MQAERLLRSGAVGTPWLVKLDWLMSSRADASRGWNWYSDRKAGGGVIGALGTHAFDTLAWLIGPVGSVQALNSVSIPERPGADGAMKAVDAEDVALIQTTLNWQGRSDCAVPAQLNLASVARQGRGCWLEVYGSKGTLILGSENQKDYVHGFSLWHASSGEPLRSIQADADLAFSTTWSDGRVAPVARIQGWWAESMRSGQPMVPGLMEGVASRLACDAAASK
jgi:predicted dehydrogenase